MKAAPMHILFIADPLSGFKIHKETTYARLAASIHLKKASQNPENHVV
jgi:hypothetical protein